MEQADLPHNDEPTQNSEYETTNQSCETNSDIASAPGKSKPNPPECRYKVSCKTEKNW